MNKITAIRYVQLNSSTAREINIVCDNNGVVVKLRTCDNTDTYMIDYADADNVEMLSTMFEHEQVCVFKIIVEMIGWMIRNRSE